jgi:hypothetical protein
MKLTKRTWQVLPGVILIGVIVWLISYYLIGWHHGNAVASFLVAITAALLGMVVVWAISEGAAELNAFAPIVVGAMVGSAVAVGITGFSSKDIETIFVDCSSSYTGVDRPWIEANNYDYIEWRSNPYGKTLKVVFKSGTGPFSTVLAPGKVVEGMVTRATTFPVSYGYTVYCEGVPSGANVPMIQIPRR